MPGSDYPRDMVGYGRSAPNACWPGRSRVAVQFVINYEEGGENCILHGDAASEAFLSEIVGAQPWVGKRHMNMESIYEYGSRAGYWRLHRMFTERNLPVTVFGVTMAMARTPDVIASMQEAGWEMASHGLRWIDYANLSREEEKAHIEQALAWHEELTGAPPPGWYQGRSSVNTLELLAEVDCLEWLADAYADDLPYWQQFEAGQRLVVPYTLDVNDMRFATPQGFNTGDQFYTYLKDTFDTLYEEGEAAPKMMSVGLHCRLVGRPGRARSLARFLDYIQQHDRVWVATRGDIARHWKKTYPAPEGG